MLSLCPISPDDLSEELYFGRDSAATQTFQVHLRDCLKCRRINDEALAMIEAMRAAAEFLERKQELKKTS